jgi:hypothetical protein
LSGPKSDPILDVKPAPTPETAPLTEPIVADGNVHNGNANDGGGHNANGGGGNNDGGDNDDGEKKKGNAAARSDRWKFTLRLILWLCCAAIAVEFYFHVIRIYSTNWDTTAAAAFIGVSILVFRALSSSGKDDYGHDSLPPTVTWTDDKLAESLDKIFKYVFGRAESATRWYQNAKQPMKRGGQYLRVGAILAGVAAGLIPLIGPIAYPDQDVPKHFLAWAPVILAFAGLLILLDKYLGCTSAWVRYVSADVRLQKAMTAYVSDTNLLRSQWAAGKPSRPDAKMFLDRTKTFATEIDQAVAEETQQWIDEFKTALKKVDETVDPNSKPATPEKK